MDSPYEVDAVAAASLYELVNVLSLLGRVGQTPVRTAVIRIVLRTVHILVEFVASVVVDERETHLMRPRFAVETLYNATQWQVGIVVAGECRHLALRCWTLYNLAQSLKSVERATLVVAHDVDTLLVDSEEVCSRHHLLQTCLLSLLLAEDDCERGALSILFEEIDVVCKLTRFVDELHTGAEVGPSLHVHVEVVRCWVYDDAVVVELLTRHHVHILLFTTLRVEVEALGLRKSATASSCEECCEKEIVFNHCYVCF